MLASQLAEAAVAKTWGQKWESSASKEAVIVKSKFLGHLTILQGFDADGY